MTFEEKFRLSEGRPSGFDYLRMALSVAVIAWHTLIVCYGRSAEVWFWTGPLRPMAFAIIPCFFALSGFLVAGSLERNNLPSFVMLRMIRIFPALVVEIVLSALILGPLLTTLPLLEYFSDVEFRTYLLNIIGLIHYNLPGIFADLPFPRTVNAQLWTVPFELECYVAIVGLALIGLVRRSKLFFAAVCILVLAVTVYKNGFSAPDVLDGRAPGRLLVLCFLSGAVLFLLRRIVAFHWGLFAVSVAFSWVLLSFTQTMYLASLPIAYCTAFVGLLDPKRLLIIQGSDYSYGLYLYGFPFQQLISYSFPEFRFWWFNLLGTLVLGGVFAAFSWHVVEKPVLMRKNFFLGLIRKP